MLWVTDYVTERIRGKRGRRAVGRVNHGELLGRICSVVQSHELTNERNAPEQIGRRYRLECHIDDPSCASSQASAKRTKHSMFNIYTLRGTVTRQSSITSPQARATTQSNGSFSGSNMRDPAAKVGTHPFVDPEFSSGVVFSNGLSSDRRTTAPRAIPARPTQYCRLDVVVTSLLCPNTSHSKVDLRSGHMAKGRCRSPLI